MYKEKNILSLEEMTGYIEDFLKNKSPAERKYIRKLLLERKEGFIVKWKDEEGDISEAVKGTVISDTGGKTETLRRMKDFIAFLENKKGFQCEISWPPIDDIGNRYERLVFIMRELQTDDWKSRSFEKNVSVYLSELLWVNERTIEDDISYIMPPIDKSVSRDFMRQSFTINGMTRSKGFIHFASTAHPFFLIENLTSVLVMIEALLEKAVQLPFREQSMTTVQRVWKQLTPYARDRIGGLLEDYYPAESEELKLFHKMKDVIDTEVNYFEQEKSNHKEPVSYLLDAVKQEIPCRVEYAVDGWEYAEWRGTITGKQIRDSDLVVEEGRQAIPFENIVAVTLLPKN